jgi:hypothetical protein
MAGITAATAFTATGAGTAHDLREFLELGFDVAVVRDAVAAPKIPEGDDYLAALINFRYMADGLWTTDETVRMLRS